MGATLNFNGGGAADAKISNSGTMTFQNGGPDFNGNQVGASAGNSTITNDSVVNFYGNCSAGSATIVNNVSGKVIFKDFCTADRATIKNNGLVDFSQLESATTTAGSFEGSGSVFLGSKGITVGANNQSTTFSGSIKDGGIKVSNGGSFGKNGTGTLTLSGDSNYTGGTVVTTGTLQIGEGGTGGSITGKVTDDSVLAFNRSNTLTFDGDISGKGSVQAIGTGTTILLGNNMYSGGTTINAGLISFSAANNLGTGPIILNGGGLQWRPNNNADISARLSPLGVRGGKFDTGGNDVAFATSLSGGGGLTKMGLRTLTLAMGNSYAGPTNVNGGTLRGGFANAFSRGSFTTVNADGTLELGGLAQTIDNVSLTGGTIQNGQLFGKITSAGGTVRSITGTSSLTTTGGSTIVLGDNSYPGGVTVSGGILQLGNGQKSAPSLEGNIMNNGMVAFQPYSLDTLTFGGNISGSGSVEQNGLGVTTLKGLNAYTGTITVKSGTLELYGPVASTNIQNAGTLKFLGRTAPSGGPVKAQISKY
jgi:fibronectin-binding autotransporter adhesin